MKNIHVLAGLFVFSITVCSISVTAAETKKAALELEQALELVADVENGKKIYMTCSVCHEPEGWGREDGYYPQIAGQHYSVVIKQLADIRARNRDNPTMFPFTLLDNLSIQDIADVSAYIATLPMTTRNAVGPGNDLVYGEMLYRENCEECHGANGEGIANEHMPLIQGQHYPYLVRQFDWIRLGKRRNADREMVRQIKGFSERDVSAIMDYVSRLQPPTTKLAQPGWANPDFPNYVRTPEQQPPMELPYL